MKIFQGFSYVITAADPIKATEDRSRLHSNLLFTLHIIISNPSVHVIFQQILALKRYVVYCTLNLLTSGFTLAQDPSVVMVRRGTN